MSENCELLIVQNLCSVEEFFLSLSPGLMVYIVGEDFCKLSLLDYIS